MRRTWSTLYLRTIAMHAIGRLAAKTRSVSGDDPALTVVQAALAPGQSQLSSGNIGMMLLYFSDCALSFLTLPAR
jgi:hypothetical protein